MSKNSIERNIRGVVREFKCGHCHASAGYSVGYASESSIHSIYGDFVSGNAVAVLLCSSCQMQSILVFEVHEEDYGGPMTDFDLHEYEEAHPEVIYPGFDESENSISPTWIELQGQYPTALVLGKDVPKPLVQDLIEAGNCLAVGASNATAIMCRRVIKRLAAHYGVAPQPGRLLGRTLAELEALGAVGTEMMAAFREIKDWGNIGSHPGVGDFGLQVAEAYQVFELTKLLVEHAFPGRDYKILALELAALRKARMGNGGSK